MGIKLTVDRLIDTIAPALAVGDAAEAGGGAEANTAGDGACLVADDVAEEVVGDDDAVEGAGVLDHKEGGAVDELVLQRELGERLGEDVGHDAAPQAARGQHVGLIERGDGGGRIARQRKVRGEAGHALDLSAGVRLGVEGEAGDAVVLGPVPEVDAARQLADQREVRAAAHVGLERRVLDQRVRREEARSQVPVRPHLLAQTQDPLLRPHLARAPFRAPDRSQQHRVRRLGGLQGLVRQRVSVGVDGGLVG